MSKYCVIGVFALLSILVFKDYLALVPAAVFAGVLLKAGVDVCDKDLVRKYIKLGWYQSSQRNIQFGIILYTTAITVFVDLNIAVLTGTVLYYGLKYFLNTKDAESDLSEVSEHESKLITG